ncbi:MarC family protein [Desulfovibrio mangrovi]|uniref:MarC family protein n=1 Tax=Desulfovibrio mangrovi TaxID=2976983 RepID=UPI0022482556|nr:MarC family protein [Desulfovibrio mangrovi]UZP68410.1 MarC family protein [Desulfovibrio mangrovi]
MEHLTLFISTYIKMFFVLAPFFVMTMFLALTKDMPPQRQKATALRVTLAVIIICISLFFFGDTIFAIFGITLDSFRIGAGALLFLSAVELVRGTKTPVKADQEGDISVVPLAIPITVGPATTGALLIMGAQMNGVSAIAVGTLALVAAIISMGVLLYLAPKVEKIIGTIGLSIMTKITGLVLAALSAQIIFTGVKNFLA